MSARFSTEVTAASIASAVGGRVVGAAGASVRGVAPLDRAERDDVSFFAAAKYGAQFAASRAGVVIVAPDLADHSGSCAARVVVANPHDALLSIIALHFQPDPVVPGVHATAIVAPTARLGDGVRVDPYAVIGEHVEIGAGTWIGSHCVVEARCAIGAQSRLFPHVTMYADSVVGARCTLHSGVRIGSDGFGYVFREGAHVKFPQVGGCIVGNDVEIGANSTIDRGSIDDTRIGDGTKIDNLVQVGHNVRIGRLCLLMAGVGVAGSARIGDGVILAGQSGVGGHVTIGAGARIAAQAGAISNVPAGETRSGFPARPHREWMRAQAALFRLAGYVKELERLARGEPL